MRKAALIYGSDTGFTEEVTHDIVESIDFLELEVKEVSVVDLSFFLKFDIFILGLSTWYDGDLQSDWELFFEDFKKINFTGKTVAIYGLGDQHGYHEYFIDGVGIIAKVVLQNGGKIVGYWPTEGYDFTESKALVNKELFYGLAIDEDNETELTTARLKKWIAQLKNEF
tara:strand:- start:3808 stop:4314 length:507 start_codon:yes stop_codon:yes gene_type:complete